MEAKEASGKVTRFMLLPHKTELWESHKAWLQRFQTGEVVVGEESLQAMYAEMHKDIGDVTNLKAVFTKKHFHPWLCSLYSSLLPFIATLALRIEDLFGESKQVKILQQSTPDVNRFTKEQAACLLAHMFFLTMPRQEDSNILPDTYDFRYIITSVKDKARTRVNLQKLICILNYFRRVQEEIKAERVTECEEKDEEKITGTSSPFSKQMLIFERLHVDSDLEEIMMTLQTSEEPLGEVEIYENKGIESFEDYPCIHTDFANAFLGGGVLRTGLVQEEIAFSVAPELMVGILFTQKQNPQEAVMIAGAERFCEFSGYAETFAFKGDHYFRKLDVTGEMKSSYTLAINATPFKMNYESQFQVELLNKEFKKALVGFAGSKNHIPETSKIPIVSGNWGCGVYKGDPQFKFLIQLLAASVLKRKLVYCSFANPELKQTKFIAEKLNNKPAKQLYSFLCDYSHQRSKKDESVFELLLKVLPKL